jgi:hypothetical protein
MGTAFNFYLTFSIQKIVSVSFYDITRTYIFFKSLLEMAIAEIVRTSPFEGFGKNWDF